MSYWSNNPELYDEIITKALPEPWLSRVESGEIELEDVPKDIRYHAAIEGEQNYWADRADAAWQREKARRRNEI